jgi:hypothetical protein
MTFDWTINFGHLLAVVGMVGGIAALVFTLRSDVNEIKVQLEPINKHLEKLAGALVQIARQDEQIKFILQMLKSKDRSDG